MGYMLNGEELETGEENFLLEANFSDEIVPVIAAAEGIKLTDEHLQVVAYLRDKYKEDAVIHPIQVVVGHRERGGGVGLTVHDFAPGISRFCW